MLTGRRVDDILLKVGILLGMSLYTGMMYTMFTVFYSGIEILKISSWHGQVEKE